MRSFFFLTALLLATCLAAQPPAEPEQAEYAMKRLKSGRLKVEEWHLPGDVTLVEVSRSGDNTQTDLDSFRRDVVDKLLAAGVEPSDRSKTEAGSSCE
jgi:hypothetical protein